MRGSSEDLANRPARTGVVTSALGGALLGLAGHVALLDKYGTVLPYRDQWKSTAVDILRPWLDGSLGWRSFFEPLNDHWPVLTRALSFLLVQLNGQWNNLVETSVNALLFAAAAAVFLRFILPGLQTWTRPAFAVLTGVVMALPITWENTLWGIQSLVYLQILLSLLYFASACAARHFSVAWWCGVAAGALLLLTQHSAVLAHIAVALLLAWRWWRGDGDRRVNLAGLGFAISAILLFATLFPSITNTAALKADSWAVGLDVFLRQLAWPLPHPAWAFFVYLPWVIWISNRLTSRRMDSCDAFILVVGLWIGAQAAAIGYGRGAATYTFVSRYCDFLALGFLLNAACLVRLSMAFPTKRIRAILVLFAIAWVWAPIRSFHWESVHSHAGYNLSRRPEENTRNLNALQTYFASGDASLISDDGGRGLYSYPPELLPLLADPQFQALLPPETGSPRARSDHGRIGWLAEWLLPHSTLLVVFASALLGTAALSTVRNRRASGLPPIAPGDFTWKGAAMVLTAFGLLGAAALLTWEAPTVFKRSERLKHAFRPSEVAPFIPLEFTRGDGDAHPIVSAGGALEAMPPDARPLGYGTRLSGQPDFRGILYSQPFPVRASHLAIPFTGYPCADGNGLRWRMFDPATNQETWISYVGPNPGVDWDVWLIDATQHRGAEASLYLFDGREDHTGWVGVAQPAQTDDADFRTRWLALLRQERTDGAHTALAGFTFVCLSFAAASAIIHRTRSQRRAQRNC